MHPRSKHRHLIDYAIVQRTDRQDVRVTKTKCGADCWTDQRLNVSKLNLRIQPAMRPQCKKAPKRLDTSKLNQDILNGHLQNWTVFHHENETVHSSAASTLGPPSRKHKD